MFVLTEHVSEFSWFSHMWNHQQPHLYDNLTHLELDMMLNKNFAKVCQLSEKSTEIYVRYFRSTIFLLTRGTLLHLIMPEFIQSMNLSTRHGKRFGTSELLLLKNIPT
jgi:hypothetical protein